MMKKYGIQYLPVAFSFPCVESATVGKCISDIYTWSLAIVGIIAFVQIFYAGVVYLTAAGNVGRISQARDKIFKAILGLVLLFSSYLILYTINPDLVGGKFSLPDLGGEKTQERDYDEEPPPPEVENPQCSDGSDNDSDGKIDFPDDLECAGAIDNDESDAGGNPPPGANLCGNGTIDSGEECDGTNLSGQTCKSMGFSGGTLGCSSTLRACRFNTSGCTSVSTIGSGTGSRVFSEVAIVPTSWLKLTTTTDCPGCQPRYVYQTVPNDDGTEEHPFPPSFSATALLDGVAETAGAGLYNWQVSGANLSKPTFSPDGPRPLFYFDVSNKQKVTIELQFQGNYNDGKKYSKEFWVSP